MPAPRSALLVLIVVLAGCTGGQPQSDPAAERIVNESVDALQRVDSYRYTIDGTVEITQGDQSRSIRISGSGVLNATQQRMRSTARGDGDNKTAFVDGDTVYVSCPSSRFGNVDDAWYPASNLSTDGSWRDATDLAVGRFLQGVPVSDAGNDTLDGNRTRVVVALPSPDQFRDLESRLTVQSGENLNRGRIQNVSVRVWFDAKTDRPHQIRYEVRSSVDGATLRQRQTVRFQYQPATVSLPRTVPTEDACPDPA